MAAVLRCVAFLGLLALSSSEVLKVGGPIQTTGVGANGKAAFELWANWLSSNSNWTDNNSNFTVEFHWESTSDIASAVTTLTAAGPNRVDVLICPYGSSGSITAIGAVDATFTGPIIVWGGASDTIFSSSCASSDKKCFGFFTPGSQYASSSLAALDLGSSDVLSVGLIENSNGFSTSVCDGANTTVSSASGLSHSISISTSVQSSINSADEALVDSVIAAQPDVVVICGHNGMVEPVIVRIGMATSYTPKAIVATNSITSASDTHYGNDLKYQNCIMMPTQWAEGSGADSIIGWTTADFKAALGSQATYHAASAAAAGIAITHAMHAGRSNVSARVGNLAMLMAALNVPSFYGTLSFQNNGAISKPMFTQQKKGDNKPIVAPASAKTEDPSTNIASCTGWSTDVSGATNTARGAALVLVAAALLLPAF